MLQQLTRDINQHPKKVRVMHELVKSVAAGKCFIQEASTGNVDWLHHTCSVVLIKLPLVLFLPFLREMVEF